MRISATKNVILNGIMIALVFLATFFTKIPIPMTQGYFNIGDTVIIITAILLGGRSGMVVGALGSCLADIAGGYFIFAPITLIVKGLEGLAVGTIAGSMDEEDHADARRLISIIIGSVVMVAGYFLAEWFILKLFDSTFGYVAAVTELPLNLLQGGISAVVGYILSTLLVKVNVRKYITR